MTQSIYGGTKILPYEQHPLNDGSWKVDKFIPALHHLGIQDWEQLYSLASVPDNRSRLLTDILALNEDDASQLMDTADVAIPSLAKERLATHLYHRFPLGAKKLSEEEKLTREKLRQEYLSVSNLHSLTKISALETLVQAPGAQLASSVNYVSQLPAVKNQGDRGTCVAFAVTAINEFYFARKNGFYTDLSEQYLYCETKNLEEDGACGAGIGDALQIISAKGQCPENTWSYNPNLPCLQQAGQPSNADQMALPFRNGYVPYDPAQDLIIQIKGSLTLGNLIAFSIPVFSSWYQNNDTANTGRILMPLTGETPIIDNDGHDKGHAMAIVGYQDSQDAAGGGYFIIRNSWGGQNWGAQNVYAPGYGTIPYAFISTYQWEVYAI